LDGRPVSLQEQIHAVAFHHHDHEYLNTNQLRWKLALQQHYGKQQLKQLHQIDFTSTSSSSSSSSIGALKLGTSPAIVGSPVSVRSKLSLSVNNNSAESSSSSTSSNGESTLVLRDCQLFAVQLAQLPWRHSIVGLDLAGNPLRQVAGLEELGQLRWVNLSGCPHLDLEDTLGRLSQAGQFLEEVSLGLTNRSEAQELWQLPVDQYGCVEQKYFQPYSGQQQKEWLLQRHPLSLEYRMFVLEQLLDLHLSLYIIDGLKVSVYERAEWLQRKQNRTSFFLDAAVREKNVEKYRFQMLTAQKCSPSVQYWLRNLHPNRLIDLVLDRKNIVTLHLSNCSLNEVVSLTA
jgi:hypothetical protein